MPMTTSSETLPGKLFLAIATPVCWILVHKFPFFAVKYLLKHGIGVGEEIIKFILEILHIYYKLYIN